MARTRSPDDLLLFTPVSLRRRVPRAWTAEAQRAFIDALSRSGLVTAAARSVGKSARSAYQLRARPDAASFAAAWDWALEMGLDAARDAAVERSGEPVTTPIIRRGRIVGERLRPNDRMVLAALRAFDRRHAMLEHRGRIAYRDAVAEADARLGPLILPDDPAGPAGPPRRGRLPPQPDPALASMPFAATTAPTPPSAQGTISGTSTAPRPSSPRVRAL